MLNTNISAQSVIDSIKTEKQLSVLTGINFWKNSLFAEVGLAKYKNSTDGHHLLSSAYFISTEVNLLTGKNFIIGPKIGGWISGGVGAIALGANLIYYTDFKNSNLYFRPEIGFGLMRVKIVYGYNARLTKNKLEGIPKSNIGIIYLLPLKKK
ncbi:hypothetical protein [Epilithonimonas sp. UC225_85]|uniref:hypothetical protein n=1 Tax=Epilithonimonas sp. UC225_85 TaxID=3350167 RepID=UPI0036D36447